MKKEELINKIRRFQTIFSILLFIIVFAFCWRVTNFDITEIQLSKWSDMGQIGVWWNRSLMLLAISMFFNQCIWINRHTRMIKKKLIILLFLIVSLCLFFTGWYDISVRTPHNFFAFSYFFLYPTAIFFCAYLNRKHFLWRHWMHILIISTAMIVLPLSFMPIFNGFAIAEIVHTISVLYWNLWIMLEKKSLNQES